jgi:hypothetical protein
MFRLASDRVTAAEPAPAVVACARGLSAGGCSATDELAAATGRTDTGGRSNARVIP